jgi:MFS family permease
MTAHVSQLPAAYSARLSARAVVTATFFAFSIGLGLWAGSIPALMRQTGLTVEGLGGAIALHSALYIGAMALGGQAARQVAPRRLMLVALLILPPSYALLFSAASVAMLVAALAVTGLGSGLLDLAMNAEGAVVEREQGRPILLSMHAAASGAFACGALAGSAMAILAAPRWSTLLVLAVVLPVAWAVHRLGPRLPAVVDAAPPEAMRAKAAAAPGDRAAAFAGPARPPPAASAAPPGVFLIGIVLGLTIGAEMAAQMWSARFLERQAADLAALAGAGAAFFAAFQAVVRLVGDGLRHRVGDHLLILASLALTALGFLVVAGSGHFAQSLAGFALIGLGTACVVPCCFALIARRAGSRGAAALGHASLVAGAIRLPTPMLLGAAAAAWSDAWMFALVAAGALAALAIARVSTRD